MSTRFLELKSNKASSQISLGFLLSWLFSTLAVNLFFDIGILYVGALLGSWIVSWFLTSGDFVTSRRKFIFGLSYTKLSPHFEDKKCMFDELENLPNLKGVLIQNREINKKDQLDELSHWPEQ